MESQLVKGHTNVDTTINPGQTERVTSFQNLQKTSLEPAAFSLVRCRRSNGYQSKRYC